MTELPSGTVTFMFTDLAVSTRLWEQAPDAMGAALARHDGILRDAVESHGGVVVKGRGDGVHAVFETADAAVRAAVDCELAMGAEEWAVSEPLLARIGIHTGAAELRDGDYFGPSVNRAARLEGIAHGGQIVCSQATADLARDDVDAGVAFLDLGEHELRDLSRPERVFQVTAPGLDAEFPPLRSMDYVPGNLPKRASSFIGRARDLERVPNALAEFPLVTLTGVGGVGKSRLAVQVAAGLLPEFSDGAWMCELAAVRDPDAVVEAAAGVFRVTARPGATLLESLVAYLRDQQLLLILDNCEHLLRPAAALAAAIVGGCPKVRILATSREGINIEGEQILVVPSLAVPDETTDVGALAESEAVRLFVDRARAVKADFVVDDTNAESVAQLCRRLDGVPLAIESAAARVNAMNPAELARRLDHRFRLLSGGDRVAIERHQTLRATIDWSFDLLTEAEQRLLLRLSVFAGGGTLDAVEMVCAGEPIEAYDVFDLMARLVAHHLVVADDDAVETRYVLLETVRQYGEERLAELGETDAFRARQCDYFTEVTTRARDQGMGPRQVEWDARLARERDNVLAAMAFALGTRDLDRAMGLLCAVPSDIMQFSDPILFDPGVVLALPGALDHPGSATALVMEANNVAYEQDYRSRARELSEQAIAAEERLGRVPGTQVKCMAWSALGTLARGARDMVECARCHERAAEYAEKDGLLALAAIQRALMGSALASVDITAGSAAGESAVTAARRSAMPHAIALSLILLASTVTPNDPEYARALLDEAIDQPLSGGYRNAAELQAAIRAAGRLGAWPKLLRAAADWFDHQLRSGVGGHVVISGMLYLAARALAEAEPEIAAVVQGAARGLAPPESDINGPFMVKVDEDTTKLILAALGERHHAEANRQGAAMGTDEACLYARNAIERYLAG